MADATTTTTGRTFRLELISPERVLLDRTVRSAQVPAEDGLVGVLAGHAPLVSPVVPGVLTLVDENGQRHRYAVGQGFVEITKDRVRVLVDSAEHPDQIDRTRAQKAFDRARERLGKRGSDKDVDFARAEASLYRAMARLKVVASL
ncbi:MAG: ATP synthase F1 subunit epsilon [Planctomycetes bacterium]|nr:ATP synthase F1 subunit epsilon [Planctomycetota bacterium]MCC7169765.1 ATP synthase F1 subunit epsilon [Planctomycetota bacterium]